MRARLKIVSLMAMAVVTMAVAALQAQAPAGQTASEFYIGYRAAFDKATKIEDLLPYVSATMKKQINDTAPAKRPEGFEMMKMMGSLTAVKVTKETKTGTGATLTATGVDADKKTQTGEIKIVREGNAWKLDKETWK